MADKMTNPCFEEHLFMSNLMDKLKTQLTNFAFFPPKIK